MLFSSRSARSVSGKDAYIAASVAMGAVMATTRTVSAFGSVVSKLWNGEFYPEKSVCRKSSYAFFHIFYDGALMGLVSGVMWPLTTVVLLTDRSGKGILKKKEIKDAEIEEVVEETPKKRSEDIEIHTNPASQPDEPVSPKQDPVDDFPEPYPQEVEPVSRRMSRREQDELHLAFLYRTYLSTAKS